MVSLIPRGRGRPDFSSTVVTSGAGREKSKMDVTSIESLHTFSTVKSSVYIYNDGPRPILFELDGSIDADSTLIPSGASYSEDNPVTSVHLMGSVGSATVYLRGVD